MTLRLQTMHTLSHNSLEALSIGTRGHHQICVRISHYETGALTFTALHPDLVDGVVSLNGTANLVDYTRFQDAIAKSYGGLKHQKPQEYQNRSAEFFPKRFTMPSAAVTGGKEEIVPADSVLRLFDRMREHNPNVLSIHRPDGGHSTSYEDTKRTLQFVITASKPRSTAARHGTDESVARKGDLPYSSGGASAIASLMGCMK